MLGCFHPNLMNELILSRNMLYLNGLIYSREHLHRKLCYFLMVFIHFSHAFTGNLWGASKFLGVTPAMAENLPRDRGFNCKAASFSNCFPRNLAIAATTAADAVNQKDHTCANYHRLSQYIIDRLGGCWKYMNIVFHNYYELFVFMFSPSPSREISSQAEGKLRRRLAINYRFI